MKETFRPSSAAQLREIVRLAAEGRIGLRIHGHDSKPGLGPPVAADYALDLSLLNGVLSYQPEELVLRARAGTPMTDILEALRERRQHLGFEPPDWSAVFGASPGRGTIGGVLACNASGPRRFSMGAARDHFLGFTAINGRGEEFRAGGSVVKNVTGYDLPKLLAGSYGRLAIMTEVILKTLPAPADAATLIVRNLTDETALRVLRLAAAGPLELSGLAHLPAGIGGEGARTVFRLEGPMASVTERLSRLKMQMQEYGPCENPGAAAARDLWRRIRDADFFVQDPQPLWRISAPPASGAEVAARIGADRYFFDWAGGLIWLLSERAADIREAVNPTGGHATLFRAPDALRRSLPVFEPQPPALAALEQRVREAFDPLGIFNPAIAGP
jgi:glycolate oxidase FAD binding subunit